MQYRDLGTTGLRVSSIAFGAGPISTLMVGDDARRQKAVVAHAIDAGINWFDTAATYGGGESERSLGRCLSELGAASRVYVATKVRLMPDELDDVRAAVRRSFAASLERLQLKQVALLQLHNSVTHQRGDEPTSITPEDVLGPRGVAAAFRELQQEGRTLHLGITGLGQAAALGEVIRSGEFAAMQVPYHLLNPSAGQEMPSGFAETNFGQTIQLAAEQRMGVLAIRVLAGGALASHPPSPHTLKTPFFPIDLFLRDRARADRLRAALGPEVSLVQHAIRFALHHPLVGSAIIGFASEQQIDEAVGSLESDDPPLTWERVQSLAKA